MRDGGGPSQPIEVGLRRVTELQPDAPLPESDPRLVARIGEEIDRSGPMTFARFMEIALYDAEAGYYVAGATGPGRRGDFLTAPEGHPIFGWTVARRLERTWEALGRPGRFVVREHGAGTGALAAGILDGLRRSDSALLAAIRYQAIEASAARLDALRARLEAAGLGGFLEPDDDAPAVGVIVANELLDALPVHAVEGGSDGALLERLVERDGDGFRFVAGAPSSPALEARLAAEGVRLQPGQQAEVCLAVDPWVRRVAASLEAGLVLVIDYGYEAKELYAESRGSTLRAYHRHRVHADPFVAIGRQDLTAHVDLTAVERAARAAGLEPVLRTTQARWLADLGLGDLLYGLQSNPATSLEAYLAARSAVVRMLDPRATGGFNVLELGRSAAGPGDDPPDGRLERGPR